MNSKIDEASKADLLVFCVYLSMSSLLLSTYLVATTTLLLTRQLSICLMLEKSSHWVLLGTTRYGTESLISQAVSPLSRYAETPDVAH